MMDFEKSILDNLNGAQKIAASHIQGPLLILAGAGSGKTKTLTSRLAYLIGACGVPSENTLTLTFTNKASKEMQERALRLLKNQALIPPLLCTFHRFGLLFLRQHMNLLKRACDFSVLDSDEVKTLCKQLKISSFRASISQIKNGMMDLSMQDSECYKAYELYQNALKKDNLVDFDDLLFLSLKILQDNETIAKETSERYYYIMVDEYQDTNALQLEFLKKLSFTHHNLCVVGDDDQSIYGFRGADISNILNFSKHFKGAKVVKLETNYRSSAEILACANSLISHNQHRHKKTLQSFKGSHKSVVCKEYLTQKEESLDVAYQIKALLKKGENLENIAILYRLNGLSRSIEESLNALNIPYRLIGALSFYERAEVKDALAFMHLVAKKDDRFFIKRVLNKPPRGLGKIAQEWIFSLLDDENLNLEEALKLGVFKGKLNPKNEYTLKQFIAMIGRLREAFEISVEEFCARFLEETNLLKSYEKEDNYEEREGFVKELLTLLKEHFKTNHTHSLLDFLNESVLDVHNTENAQKVSCMSVHMSKGLEFKHVFVIGLEEGFFPHRGFNQESDLEEERRLAYVAITRAKEGLQLSYVQERLYFGRKISCSPSVFLEEANLLKQDNPPKQDHKKDAPIKVGDLIKHKIFGTGRVLGVEKGLSGLCLKINCGGNVYDKISAKFVEKVDNGF